MDTIKYQVNAIFEVIFGYLSDTINSTTSLFDYLLIERELVLVGLLLTMYFTMCIRTIPVAVELWDNSKEKETSRLQTIKFNKILVSTILSFAVIAFLYSALSHFYINSNLTTETDEVILVDKKFKGDSVDDGSGSRYSVDKIKFIGKRGYSVTYLNFWGKPALNEAFFNNNLLNGTIVHIDDNVYNNLKFNKDPKNIKIQTKKQLRKLSCFLIFIFAIPFANVILIAITFTERACNQLVDS